LKKLPKNQYWIFLVIIGFWMHIIQTSSIINHIDVINFKLISSVILMLISIVMISTAISLIFEWKEKMDFLKLNITLIITTIFIIILAIVFHPGFGVIYLILQMDIIMITWYRLKRKKRLERNMDNDIF